MTSTRARLTAAAERLYARMPDGLRRFVHHARIRPGHYYSPYPDLGELRVRADEVFAPRDELAGVDLRPDHQLELLDRLTPFTADLPWAAQPVAGLRYRYDNRPYAAGDGTFTALMLRLLRPQNYLEIGSGWSTALALDVVDRFVPEMSIRCVEPYPNRLLDAIDAADSQRIELVQRPVQSVDPGVAEALGAGDVLFVDSTHVAKAGSDVNQLVFEWFPRLAPGVYVHVHDIFDGFEYPREWVFQGRAWSEAYLLRAFLAFNDSFEVVALTPWLRRHRPDWFATNVPWTEHNPGASLWLRRSDGT